MNEYQDLWVVCNICVNDDSIDLEYGGSRADYFEVRWSGIPLCIPPGDTRIVPEYLADHFAKHVVDYILTRDKRMIHDMRLRDPLIAQIKLRKADESDRRYISNQQGARSIEDNGEGTLPVDIKPESSAINTSTSGEVENKDSRGSESDDNKGTGKVDLSQGSSEVRTTTTSGKDTETHQ